MHNEQRLTRIFLWIGAAFFLFEFVLHLFGLPILEHDKIFLLTHDRYIALFALTYAALLLLVSSDVRKYATLFKMTMVGILFAMLIAASISWNGGYVSVFPVENLDKDLSTLGWGFLLWYLLTLYFFFTKK